MRISHQNATDARVDLAVVNGGSLFCLRELVMTETVHTVIRAGRLPVERRSVFSVHPP